MNFPEKLDPEDLRLASKEWRLAGYDLLAYALSVRFPEIMVRDKVNHYLEIGHRDFRGYSFRAIESYKYNGLDLVWRKVGLTVGIGSIQVVEIDDKFFEGEFRFLR